MKVLGNSNYRFVRDSSKNRLITIDKNSITFFQKNNIKKLDFLEVAGSSFITTIEIIKLLRENSIQVNSVCSDLMVFAYEYKFLFFSFLFSKHRKIIYIYFFRYRIKYPYRRLFKLFFVFNFFLYIEKRINRLFKYELPDKLINMAISEIQKDKTIKFLEDDITFFNHTLERKFDFIRVAHCLNNIKRDAYENFENAVKNLKKYLKDEKSLLLVVSNDIHGTFFSLNSEGKLYVVDRINDGCIVEDMEQIITKI